VGGFWKLYFFFGDTMGRADTIVWALYQLYHTAEEARSPTFKLLNSL
jgi:hypothetical protein